jgi:hypothetical protein
MKKAAGHLLDKESQRFKKIKRWKRAAKLAAKESLIVNKEFQKYTRIRE